MGDIHMQRYTLPFKYRRKPCFLYEAIYVRKNLCIDFKFDGLYIS